MKVEGNIVMARVWTRALLAGLCDLTEEQLVEWALVAGNDYTLHLSRYLVNVPVHAWCTTAEKVRDFF